MRAKLFTYKIIRPLEIPKSSGDTYRGKRRGEIGEPWGVPTLTGAGVLGVP